MMNKEDKCLILLHISTFILAFNALFAKLIILPAAAIIGFRAYISMLVLTGYIKSKRGRVFTIHSHDLKWIILLGVLLTIHFVSFFYAIQISTVAIGMLALATTPILTALVEAIEKRRFPHYWDVIAGILILVGIGFIIPEFTVENNIFQGVLWGLVSSLTFALRNVMSKRFVRRYNGEEIMCIQLAVVALVLSSFVWESLFEISLRDGVYLLIMGVFTTAIAHTMLLKGLEGVEAKTASIIWNLQPLYSILLAVFFLSEVPQASVMIGGVIIIGAVVIETILVKKKKTIVLTEGAAI